MRRMCALYTGKYGKLNILLADESGKGHSCCKESVNNKLKFFLICSRISFVNPH